MPGGERVESPFKDRLERLCRSLEDVWKGSKSDKERELIYEIVEEALIKPSADLAVSFMRARAMDDYEDLERKLG